MRASKPSGTICFAATVSSRGFAAVLEQATRLGESKLQWKQVGLLDRDVMLLPRHIEFERPVGGDQDLDDEDLDADAPRIVTIERVEG